MKKKKIGTWLLITILLVAMLLISACQSSPGQEDSPAQGSDPSGVSSSSGSDTEDGAEDSEGDAAGSESGADPMVLAQEEWQASAHASTFVVDAAGVNNPCSKCHAPKNWSPTLDDIPESCQACKFELPEPPPFIAESEWMHVNCVMCHTVDKKGNVQAEVAWLEIPALDEYASVESPSDLCINCHNTEGVAEHGQVVVGSGHADMTCLECHTPHSTTVSCVSGDCHADVFSEADQIIGHDEDHQDVSCAACHDSAGWDVGPHPETGIWTTFSPWSLAVPGGEEDSVLESGTVPFLSHDLGLEVNCERCHFPGNTWGLTESVETP